MLIFSKTDFSFARSPDLIYFFNMFKRVDSNMLKMFNIEEMVLRRIDIDKYFECSSISPYRLIVNDIIENKEIFKPLGININSEYFDRRYQIFRAYELIVAIIVKIYVFRGRNCDYHHYYDEEMICKVARIILKNYNQNKVHSNLKHENITNFIHTGYRFYRVFEKYGFIY